MKNQIMLSFYTFVLDVAQCFFSPMCLIVRFLSSLQEADYPVHEQIDLYDDVISPSANNGDAPEDREYLDALPAPGGTEGGKSAPPNVVYTYTSKRIALYIGNLTWVGVRGFACSLT